MRPTVVEPILPAPTEPKFRLDHWRTRLGRWRRRPVAVRFIVPELKGERVWATISSGSVGLPLEQQDLRRKLAPGVPTYWLPSRGVPKSTRIVRDHSLDIPLRVISKGAGNGMV